MQEVKCHDPRRAVQDALVKEHLVKLLTKPLGYESRLDVGDLQLDGFNKAHAAALSFCLDIQHGHLMRTWGQDVPAAALKSLTLRCSALHASHIVTTAAPLESFC